MDVTHSRAIIFLLTAILSVMLFGASGVLSVFMWGGAALAFLFFLVLAGRGIANIIGSVRQEIEAAKVEGRPWRWLLVAYPAIAGNIVVVGLAAFNWIGQSVRFRDALGEVPYYWVPVGGLFISMIVAAIESARDWVPNMPLRLKDFLRGWLSLIVSPLFAPIGRWRKICEMKEAGHNINVIYAMVSIIYVLLISIFIWIIVAIVPAIFLSIAIYSIL